MYGKVNMNTMNRRGIDISLNLHFRKKNKLIQKFSLFAKEKQIT